MRTLNMQLTNPTVISLFAGCGGSSLGYQWAGFKELLAIDWDSRAVESFRANFQCPVWKDDIAKVSGDEILRFCNLTKGELDILDGSPPCQGFSTAGKQRVTDPRNELPYQFLRLVNELKPRVFVMENVPGMVRGRVKGLFVEIMLAAKALPYRVKCKRMNSKYYGVPQARERLIFIGVRNDLEIEPCYPAPTLTLISTKEALRTVKEPGPSIEPRSPFIRSVISRLRPGDGADKFHKNKSFFNTRRAHYDKPCQTITSMPCIIHPIENRYLTINECKILCSFPEEWITGDSFNNSWHLLGNAVMPKFMEAIATAIRINILERYHGV